MTQDRSWFARSALVLGVLIMPFTFYIYTSVSASRIRCHVPSWSSGHWPFELTGYALVLISGLSVLFFGLQSLRHSRRHLDDLAALMFVVMFNVFSFALVYYSYGLTRDTGFLIEVPTSDSKISGILVLENGQNKSFEINSSIEFVDRRLSIEELKADDGKSEPKLAMFQKSSEMVANPYTYLGFSFSNIVPGGDAFNVEVCPSASWIVAIQNMFGLMLTILFALYSTRLSKIFS